MSLLKFNQMVIVSVTLLSCVRVTQGQLRISHVGKNSSVNVNAYNGQFVEIYNAGSAAVTLAGKSIQWASSAGGIGWSKFDLDGTIAPNGYWLVRLSATTAGNNLAFAYGKPFASDQTRVGFNGNFFSAGPMGDAGGKVVLADTTTLFTTNGCNAPDAAHVLDLVSWDDIPSTSVCHEGSACAFIPLPAWYPFGVGATAVLRLCGGLIDSDDNAADFITTARPPRNSAFAGLDDGPAVDGMTRVTGQSGRGITTAYAGQTVLFTTRPTTCSGSVTSVTINLAPVGGPEAQTMVDDGTSGDEASEDGVYSFLYTVPLSPSAPHGNHLLVITATDSSARTGTGDALLTVAPPPPLNDLCGNAEVIPAGTVPMFVSATGNLVSASPITKVMTSCTTNSGNAGTSRDAWFSFTPIETAAYTVTTCNAVTAPGLFNSQDTVISIHATCPPDDTVDIQGQSLACNDQGCTNFIGGGPSTIFNHLMDEGITYLIRVSRFGSGDSIVGGPFRLDILSESFGVCCFPNGTCRTLLQSECDVQSGSFSANGTTCSTASCPPPLPPANDDCGNATVLALGVPEPGTTYGASGSDITTCDQTSWDTWYAFTPPITGSFRVDVTLIDGSQTPAIAIFDACPPVTDANLACITAPLSGNSNALIFAATAETPYWIRVATNFSQRSDFSVVINPDCSASGGTGDGNASGTTDGLDIQIFVTILANGGPFGTAYCAYDMNHDDEVALDDVPLFIAALLSP